MPPTRFLTLLDSRLRAAFGPPPNWLYPDPVEILVLALLSARTRDKVSLAAIRILRVRFPRWEMLLEADPHLIERLVGKTTRPEQKAHYLQEALRALQAARGRLELDFLSEQPVEAASAWLRDLPGVGFKTAASVLLFSRLRRRILPVCTGHLRAMKRLRVVSQRASADSVHWPLLDLLPADWGVDRIEQHHWLVKSLAQEFCKDVRPLCWRCPVRDLCPTHGRIRTVPPQPARQLDLPLHGAAHAGETPRPALPGSRTTSAGQRTRIARKSLTLVRVGPVTTSRSSAAK